MMKNHFQEEQKMLNDIYQRCNFVVVKKENYEEAIKHDVWKKVLAEKSRKIGKNNTQECVSIPKEREVEVYSGLKKPNPTKKEIFTNTREKFRHQILEFSRKCIKGECWI